MRPRFYITGYLAIPVCSWCHVIFFFVQPVKIGQVIESCAFRDGQDAVIFREQKPGGNGKPVAIQIACECCVQMLLEEFHKMRFGKAQIISGTLNGNRFCIM